jgi:flagellar biosynthesis anti-sigma factor FlgM
VKVNDQNPLGSALPSQTGKTGALQSVTRVENGAAKTGKAAEDSAEISSFTERLAQSMQAGDAARAAHVSRIAEAVRSGRYEVDAQAVSRSMIRHALSERGSDFPI